MRKKGIDFVIRVDEDCSRLTFDRDRIEQVIQNLLANSIKNVPMGGTISISAASCGECPSHIIPPAILKYISRVAFADLCLKDSGSGIPPEVAGEINMVDSSLYGPARASKGLGLIIAKRLVRLHGGSLVIEEGTGGGGAVHLYLPVDPESARIVQTYRNTEMRFEEMLAKGLTPTVSCVSKDTRESWAEAVRGWRPAPLINPSRSDMTDRATLLWPLSEGFALALAASVGSAEGVRAGWAVGPREGASLREIISIALERMERGSLAPVTKGVDG